MMCSSRMLSAHTLGTMAGRCDDGCLKWTNKCNYDCVVYHPMRITCHYRPSDLIASTQIEMKTIFLSIHRNRKRKKNLINLCRQRQWQTFYLTKYIVRCIWCSSMLLHTCSIFIRGQTDHNASISLHVHRLHTESGNRAQ